MGKNLILKCLFASLLSGACIYLTEKSIANESLPTLPVTVDPASNQNVSSTSVPMPKKMVMLHVSVDDKRINDIEVELMPTSFINSFLSLCQGENGNTAADKTLKDFTLKAMGDYIYLVENTLKDSNETQNKMNTKIAFKLLGKVTQGINKADVDNKKIVIEECVSVQS
jgi:hypothetical protein